MFDKTKQQISAQPKSSASELKDLLTAESNTNEGKGILQIARSQMTDDLSQKKISRAIEIINGL